MTAQWASLTHSLKYLISLPAKKVFTELSTEFVDNKLSEICFVIQYKPYPVWIYKWEMGA